MVKRTLFAFVVAITVIATVRCGSGKKAVKSSPEVEVRPPADSTKLNSWGSNPTIGYPNEVINLDIFNEMMVISEDDMLISQASRKNTITGSHLIA